MQQLLFVLVIFKAVVYGVVLDFITVKAVSISFSFLHMLGEIGKRRQIF